jgi:hypothetical protein
MDPEPLIIYSAEDSMTKFKIISLGSLAVAGVVAALMIQHKSQVKLGERDALVRQQDLQLAALTAEYQRLSNLVAHTNSVPPDDHRAELARLRGEAEALKKQTNDAGRRLEASRASRPPQTAPSPPSHTAEYWTQLHQMAGAKATDAMSLATAFIFYANEHQDQFPSSFDQMTPYQAKAGVPFSGTNQFEIVCQGSFDKLQGIPPGTVAVVRDRQTWAGPDGKLMRVYGLADGSSQIVESDDNFQTWEATHVIKKITPP